jgi:hypothetical protein
MSVGTYAGPESHLTGPDWRAVSRDEELTRRLDKARASDGVALWVGFSRTQFEGTEVPFKEQLQACRGIFAASEGEPGQGKRNPRGEES